MSMNHYGGFIVHVPEEVLLKVVPFEFGVLQGTYDKYDLDWRSETAMRIEDYEQELGETISEEIETIEEYNEAYSAITAAWKRLTDAFKQQTGLMLGMTYLNDDEDEWHGQLEEGVNFLIDFNEAYIKSPLLVDLEKKLNRTIDIESFTVWG